MKVNITCSPNMTAFPILWRYPNLSLSSTPASATLKHKQKPLDDVVVPVCEQ